MSSFPLQDLAEYLHQLSTPAVTKYQLGLFLFRLHKKNRSIPNSPQNGVFTQFLWEAMEQGLFVENKQFPHYKVFDIPAAGTALDEELICICDPFAYISHLSAMNFHKMSDLDAPFIYVTRPKSSVWYQCAKDKMRQDLGKDFERFRELYYPQLKLSRLTHVNQKKILYHHSLSPGKSFKLDGSEFKLSSIERLFLDMVRRPDYCGGMDHILEFFQRHAERYLASIVKEIEQHGRIVEKIRAGYILEERLKLSHPLFAKWKQFACRGGSMKLDPKGTYRTTYSKEWSLILNIDRKDEK